MNLDYHIAGYICSKRTCHRISKNELTLCPSCQNSQFNPFYNFYTLLQLSNHYSQEELNKNFKKLSLIYHPDKNNGDDKNFIILKNGYEILKDENKKKIYDQTLDLFNKKSSVDDTQNNRYQVNQQEVFNHVYEVFEDIYKQKQQKPQIKIKKIKKINSILGILLGISIGLIFNIPLFITGTIGFLLSYNTKKWTHKILFSLNDFFFSFILIKLVIDYRFNISITIFSVFLLWLYFFITQKWKNYVTT